MCASGDHMRPSRRDFTALAMGGATAGLLVRHARADEKKVEALCVMCIDYRLVDNAIAFFDKRLGLVGKYDLVVLAGASLAGVSQMFPASTTALWNHVAIAHTLHAIKRVVVLDHRDCGAYKQEFGPDYKGQGPAEFAQHQGVMRRMKGEFIARAWSGLKLDFYLMATDGTVQVVPV